MSRAAPAGLVWPALILLAVACGKPSAEVHRPAPGSPRRPAAPPPAAPTPVASAPTSGSGARVPAPPRADAGAASPGLEASARPESASAASAASAATGCPPEMARVERSCIDRWEATLVALADDGSEELHPYWQVPEADRPFRARAAPGVFPQGHVSRPVAAAACEQAGKRLCSLREWHRACAGPRGLTYPYGPEGRRGTCNTAKAHLLSQLFGNDPRGWKYDEHFNSPELLRTPGYLARTGEHAGCVSADGIYDLVGNLHEWVADAVDFDLPRKITLNAEIERKIAKNLGHGIFMGGFFSTTNEHGRGCLFLTPGHEPAYHDYSTGFRCCRDAATPAAEPPE